MSRSVIFDMDGTLLDTIDFTLDAFQEALKAKGYGELPRSLLRSFLGTDLKGMSELLLRASGAEDVPREIAPMGEEIVRQLKRLEKEGPHPVKPYPAMAGIVTRLLEKGIKLAVLSNSPHDLTIHHVTAHFPTEFAVVLGEQPGIPRKPHTGGVEKVLALLDSSREETILVGDSDKDYETAVNSSCPVIMVDWGVLTREALTGLGAACIAGDETSFFDCLRSIWPDF